MTLIEKINKLTWFSEVIKLKGILKDLLSQIISVQTNVEELQVGTGVQSVSGYYVDNTDPLNPILNDPRPYKVYSGIITQTDTNSPQIILQENTIGGTTTLIRKDIGTYAIVNTLPIFAETKVNIQITPIFADTSDFVYSYCRQSALHNEFFPTVINITNYNFAQDEMQDNFKIFIEIKVYN